MNEKTDRQVKMERNESEISQGGVFYSCVHEACQQVAPKIFKWLGLASTPELLSPGMQNFATIIILQCDRGRALDDITAVHNEYLRYQGQKIIILSLSIHDAEDHTKRYCTENISTDGSITFLKIHQRANGHIHECRGNQFCRETVQSLLGIAKQKDDQSHRKVKRMRNWSDCWQTAYDIFTTISAPVRRCLNCRTIFVCAIVSIAVLGLHYFHGILGIEHNSNNNISDFK